MIPIILEDKEKKKLKNWYYEEVMKFKFREIISVDENKSKSKSGKSKYRDYEITEIFEEVNTELSNLDIDYSIENIILSDFKELKRIKNEIDLKGIVFDKTSQIARLKKIYKDKISSSQVNINLIKKLNIFVCPYCNRDYINNRDEKSSGQLDHFYDKNRYPIFALSIFNLIPVCYACNHIKSCNSINISPYDEEAHSMELIKISYNISSLEFMTNENAFNIDFRIINNNIEDDITTLKIREAYDINKNIILDAINKKIIYSDEHIEELLYSYGELFETKGELEHLIFDYSNKGSNQEPFFKLKKDIYHELDILK